MCALRGGVNGSKVRQEAGKSDLRASMHASFRFEVGEKDIPCFFDSFLDAVTSYVGL